MLINKITDFICRFLPAVSCMYVQLESKENQRTGRLSRDLIFDFHVAYLLGQNNEFRV